MLLAVFCEIASVRRRCCYLGECRFVSMCLIVGVLGGRMDRGDVVLTCAAGGGGKGSGGHVVARAAGGEVLFSVFGAIWLL